METTNNTRHIVIPEELFYELKQVALDRRLKLNQLTEAVMRTGLKSFEPQQTNTESK